MSIRALGADYDKTEEDMKALQSVGQIIGEVLKQLDDERCEWTCAARGYRSCNAQLSVPLVSGGHTNPQLLSRHPLDPATSSRTAQHFPPTR